MSKKDGEMKILRQQAMSEGYRRAYGGLSMGAQVEQTPCSLCPSGHSPHVHVEPLMQKGEFLYATTVPAPKCDSCGNAMSTHQDHDWVCTTPDCQAEGFVVPAGLLGVFPAKLLS